MQRHSLTRLHASPQLCTPRNIATAQHISWLCAGPAALCSTGQRAAQSTLAGGGSSRNNSVVLARLVVSQAAHADNEQRGADVSALDAAPALAAAASRAVASSAAAAAAANNHHQQWPGGRQQQQQKQQQPPGVLVRPTAVAPSHLRELLQQQITGASCWQDLQALLTGRRSSLTLKHLAHIAGRVGQKLVMVCCVL